MTGRAAGFIMAGILMISAIFAGGAVSVKAEGEELITSPHGVLMEASTGQIIYEKDMDARVKPASITKIMTLLLIFDELERERYIWKTRWSPVPTQNLWEDPRFFWKREKSRA